MKILEILRITDRSIEGGGNSVENKELLQILKYIGLGIIVALGGLFFSVSWSSFFNGMPYDVATTLGIGMYLCIVIVVCTGIMVSHLNRKN